MKVYPVFLNNLAGRRCVVIGGGHEAERKTEGLLESDASVTVITPDLDGRLAQWVEANQITWLPRKYESGDLEDTFLVIVSEPDPETIESIWDEAQTRNVLMCAMDDVPHCSFVAGSVVRQGPLVLSISTSGCAPVLAVRLRQHLEKTLGHEYALFLELMQSLRAPMAARYTDFEERREHWYALVDSDILELLREGDLSAVCDRIEEIAGDVLPVSA